MRVISNRVSVPDELHLSYLAGRALFVHLLHAACDARTDGYTWGAVSGSDYRMYEGQTLDEIRIAKGAGGKALTKQLR